MKLFRLATKLVDITKLHTNLKSAYTPSIDIISRIRHHLEYPKTHIFPIKEESALRQRNLTLFKDKLSYYIYELKKVADDNRLLGHRPLFVAFTNISRIVTDLINAIGTKSGYDRQRRFLDISLAAYLDVLDSDSYGGR